MWPWRAYHPVLSPFDIDSVLPYHLSLSTSCQSHFNSYRSYWTKGTQCTSFIIKVFVCLYEATHVLICVSSGICYTFDLWYPFHDRGRGKPRAFRLKAKENSHIDDTCRLNTYGCMSELLLHSDHFRGHFRGATAHSSWITTGQGGHSPRFSMLSAVTSLTRSSCTSIVSSPSSNCTSNFPNTVASVLLALDMYSTNGRHFSPSECHVWVVFQSAAIQILISSVDSVLLLRGA